MIRTVETLAELRTARSQLDEPVGLVPTMGYLHQGHLSLVQQAKRKCRTVVASIFVNPTQFGPNEDLEAYPRDLPSDLELLEAGGCDLVWIPTPEIMYPSGFQTWVNLEKVTLQLEGERRPGHFRGVATVVAKLFNAVQPQKAYFGQKDAQQVVVIRQMARDLNFQVAIEVCPTVREPDGLAMSSRNTYLTPEGRQAATVLYRALWAARQAYESGERQTSRLQQVMADLINREPLVRLQYTAISDPETLEDLQMVGDEGLFSMAVYLGDTRLIDNFLLQKGQWQVGIRI
jgi:pantoate--beta-alanine ligase